MGEKTKKEPFDFWHMPAVIAANNTVTLSNWSLNISMGCHGECLFCYVPSASVNKWARELKEYQVNDPDAQWGNYSLLRTWDEKEFLTSLKKAQATTDLRPGGNRAVLFCSTCDPYQVFNASSPEKTKLLNDHALALVEKALVTIWDQSTLNVRILTRSSRARKHFDLYKTFGKRLMFGMSLPTLDDKLAHFYEPKATPPTQRLATLQAAKEAGLHVYVAMAPTYPECDEADVRKTLAAIKELDPITVFHEPIQIRADNVKRIKRHAKKTGFKINTAVFANRDAWLPYAIDSLTMVQRLAGEAGLADRLHLWPEPDLLPKARFLKLRSQAVKKQSPNRKMTLAERQAWKERHEKTYQEFEGWIRGWWSRISEWPR